MPCIVEFIGAPGSGKTFSSLKLESLLASELHSISSYSSYSNSGENDSRIASILRMSKKAISSLSFFISKPREFLFLRSLIFSNNYNSKFLAWTLLINYIFLLSFFTKCRIQSSSAVVEQGIFQLGWPLFYYSSNIRLALKVFNGVLENAKKYIDPFMYVIVVMDPPEILLEKRMEKRGLNDLNATESKAALEVLCSTIHSLNPFSGMVLLTNDGSDVSTEKINATILDLVKSNEQKKNNYYCDK